MESSGINRRELEGFPLFYGLAQGMGAVAVILVTVWAGHYRGGFAWTSDPKLEFNWHPVLMTLSMVFLYGNGKCYHSIVYFFKV